MESGSVTTWMPSRSSADPNPSRAAESWLPLVTMMRAPLSEMSRSTSVSSESHAAAGDDDDVDVVLSYLLHEGVEHTTKRIERGMAVKRPPDVPVRGMQDPHGTHGMSRLRHRPRDPRGAAQPAAAAIHHGEVAAARRPATIATGSVESMRDANPRRVQPFTY